MSEKRTEQLVVLLTKDEKKTIQDYAQKAGLTVASFVRAELIKIMNLEKNNERSS